MSKSSTATHEGELLPNLQPDRVPLAEALKPMRTRLLLNVSLAALLFTASLAAAEAYQGRDRPMMQPGQRGPAEMERMHRRMHRMMHGDMGRDRGMRGMYGMGRRGGMHEMTGPRAMHPHMMRILFIMMDTDGDGALSLEEIQRVHERFFNAMDADDNSRLTLEEIRAFMRGGMPTKDGEVKEDGTAEEDQPGQDR